MLVSRLLRIARSCQQSVVRDCLLMYLIQYGSVLALAQHLAVMITYIINELAYLGHMSRNSTLMVMPGPGRNIRHTTLFLSKACQSVDQLSLRITGNGIVFGLLARRKK
jgi:hypothetical protein